MNHWKMGLPGQALLPRTTLIPHCVSYSKPLSAGQPTTTKEKLLDIIANDYDDLKGTLTEIIYYYQRVCPESEPKLQGKTISRILARCMLSRDLANEKRNAEVRRQHQMSILSKQNINHRN